MSTAVITLAAGRHEHLGRQIDGLLAQDVAPDRYVVAAMGDPAVAEVVAGARLPWATEVVPVEVAPHGELPLAQARNRAARAAIDAGAELLVFLDVDCIPGPALVGRYADASRATSSSEGPVVLGGTVAYLPPAPEGGYRLAGLASLAAPHAARPVPAPGELLRAGDLRLFWSLSFAVTAADWDALGGFCEEYVGYGGEDTDFAMTLAAAGGALWWVGGAPAFHQHHPVERPPHRHTEAIVRNANLFQTRWGWFPMEGWLSAFAEAGTAFFDPGSTTWRTGEATRR